MLKIGITGGIGSGKSTVAAIFEALGIPVYYADIAAKKLMNQDENLITAIKNNFGKDAYSGNTLNKEYLAKTVFNDEEKLALLNSIVHPATILDAEKWIATQTSSYIIKEAALLFESGSNKNLDLIIGVSAPLELRIQRTINRDNTTREQVMARINKQMNEEEKLSLCNFVVTNDDQHMLLPQVLELHQRFLQL